MEPPATHFMRRDSKRGSRLAVTGDGRMVMALNYGRPQGTCCGSFRRVSSPLPTLDTLLFRPHRKDKA